MDQGLVIDLRSPSDRRHADRLLDAPSLGKKDKSFGKLRAFDDLDNTVEPISYAVDEPSLVPSIDDDRLDPRAKADEPPSEWEPTVLISNVGRCDVHGEKAAVSIGCEVSLAAHHFLRGIAAAVPVGSVALDRSCIDDGQGWTGLASGFFTIRHHEQMVDAIDVTLI